MTTPEFDDAYTGYQLERGRLREWVRHFYLRRARSRLYGPTLDFGCGVGGLLEMLPPGSMGMEYNPASVAYCRARGLDVTWYDGYADDWRLSGLPSGRRFESMVISHVLEHLDTPMDVLHALLDAARGVGVRNVLVIVPGAAGFRIDPTHRTFVDYEQLGCASVIRDTNFRVFSRNYFPVNQRWVGTWFPHHELQVSYRSDA